MVISETEELTKIKSLTTLIVNSPKPELRFDGTAPRETMGEKASEWQTKWTEFLTNLDSGKPLKISNLIVAVIEMRTKWKDWEVAFRGHTLPNTFYPLKTNIFDLSIHLSDFLEAKVNRLEKGRSKIKGSLQKWNNQITNRHG